MAVLLVKNKKQSSTTILSFVFFQLRLWRESFLHPTTRKTTTWHVSLSLSRFAPSSFPSLPPRSLTSSHVHLRPAGTSNPSQSSLKETKFHRHKVTLVSSPPRPHPRLEPAAARSSASCWALTAAIAAATAASAIVGTCSSPSCSACCCC